MRKRGADKGAVMREVGTPFTVVVTLKRKTEAALLVEDEDGEEVWIPNSQVHDDSEIWDESKIGEEGKLVIPEWLALKKGWL
jgi:hypothetical protein